MLCTCGYVLCTLIRRSWRQSIFQNSYQQLFTAVCYIREYLYRVKAAICQTMLVAFEPVCEQQILFSMHHCVTKGKTLRELLPLVSVPTFRMQLQPVDAMIEQAALVA